MPPRTVPPRPVPAAPRLAVVVPVYRNADSLPELVARLVGALSGDPSVGSLAVHLVVDACPAGSDGVAVALAERYTEVTATLLPRNVGQNRAIVHGLAAAHEADLWVCMDADLQDPPEAVRALLAGLEAGAADGTAGVFAGRRGLYESRGRRLTGTAHRRVLASLTGLPADAGAFLVMTRPLRDAVVTAVRDHRAPGVVVAAGTSGLRLSSVPVTRETRAHGQSAWTSRARVRLSVQNVTWALTHPGIRSMGAAPALLAQLLSFLVIGGIGTLAYLGCFLFLRHGLPAQPANLLARVAVAVPTTWANGLVSFGVRVRRRRLWAGALFVLAAGAAVSASLLAAEHVLFGDGHRIAEVATLMASVALATGLRFVLLRSWLFRPPALITTAAGTRRPAGSHTQLPVVSRSAP